MRGAFFCKKKLSKIFQKNFQNPIDIFYVSAVYLYSWDGRENPKPKWGGATIKRTRTQDSRRLTVYPMRVKVAIQPPLVFRSIVMFDEFDMVLDFDGLGLADLFAEADAIGDKYLTDEELEERNGLLFEAQEMLSECAE